MTSQTIHVKPGDSVTIIADQPVVTPIPTPAPAGKVVQIPASYTLTQFLNACRDTTVDVVELQAGQHNGWRMGSGSLGVVRPSTKPLRIQPAAGAAVVFSGLNDGNGYGDPPFSLNGCQYVTFDGRPGSITFQDYLIGQTAVFSLGSAHHISIDGIKVRRCAAGGTSNGQSSHFAYCSGGSSFLHFEGIDMAHCLPADMVGTTAPRGALNGIHMYNGSVPTSATDVEVVNSTFANMAWAIVARDGVQRLTVDGVTATDCGHGTPAAIDLAGALSGTLKNSKSASSASTPLIRGGVSDGGNNGPWA